MKSESKFYKIVSFLCITWWLMVITNILDTYCDINILPFTAILSGFSCDLMFGGYVSGLVMKYGGGFLRKIKDGKNILYKMNKIRQPRRYENGVLCDDSIFVTNQHPSTTIGDITLRPESSDRVRVTVPRWMFQSELIPTEWVMIHEPINKLKLDSKDNRLKYKFIEDESR